MDGHFCEDVFGMIFPQAQVDPTPVYYFIAHQNHKGNNQEFGYEFAGRSSN